MFWQWLWIILYLYLYLYLCICICIIANLRICITICIVKMRNPLWFSLKPLLGLAPPENCKILCVFQRKITRSDVFFVWGVLQDLFLCIFLPLWPLIILAGRLVKNTHKSVCICFRQKPSKAQQWLEWESEWIHHLYNTDSNTNTQIRKYANTNTQIQIQIQYDS